MYEERKGALGQMQDTMATSCFVIFGSGARDTVLPGSDLDVIAIVRERCDWTYLPIEVNGLPVDLNLACPIGLEKKLRSSWYWRAMLRPYRLIGHCPKVAELLEKNLDLVDTSSECTTITNGWLEIAERHFARAREHRVDWLAHASEWHGIVSLMNGILQVTGCVPHSYHNHWLEIEKAPVHAALLARYKTQIHSSFVRGASLAQWLSSAAAGISHAALTARIHATNRRLTFLRNSGRCVDADIYLRHAYWVLLVHLACELTLSTIPVAQDEYSWRLVNIEAEVPEDVRIFFRRLQVNEDFDLQRDLTRVLRSFA